MSEVNTDANEVGELLECVADAHMDHAIRDLEQTLNRLRQVAAEAATARSKLRQTPPEVLREALRQRTRSASGTASGSTSGAVR